MLAEPFDARLTSWRSASAGGWLMGCYGGLRERDIAIMGIAPTQHDVTN